jgi:hypothetical protein
LCHDFGDSIADDLEGCLDILFENYHDHYKSEHRVVLDVLKPQDHPFFHDPFVDLLHSFNEGVCYVMDILSQESMKGLKIQDPQQVRWKLSISFFSLLKESVRKFQINRQLLDWLHWHFYII